MRYLASYLIQATVIRGWGQLRRHQLQRRSLDLTKSIWRKVRKQTGEANLGGKISEQMGETGGDVHDWRISIAAG
jgi:hypothetical protein